MIQSATIERTARRQRPLQDVVRATHARSNRKSPTVEVARSRTPKILCIDDDPEICRSLELRLSEYDVEVHVAYFGTQGYWEAITDHPDLILMDVGMPSGDGRFVLESLRNNQATERIPVIVLTGMRNEDLKNEMLSLGSDSYLNKPIHFDVLLREISQFVQIVKRPS